MLSKAVAEAARTSHEVGREEGREEGFKEGREEGREEERKATALTMRELGVEYALISKVTGFTTEEIRALTTAC